MANTSSIQYISSLIGNPATMSDSDLKPLGLLRKSYPYFMPLRYLLAARSYAEGGMSPELLSAIRPYQADWLMIQDFMDGKQPVTAEDQQDDTITAQPEPHPHTEPQQNEVAINDEEIIALPATDTDSAAYYDVEEAMNGAPEKEEMEQLIQPLYTEDYFLQQGVKISGDMPEEMDSLTKQESDEDRAKSLMVMMSFSEWLMHFKHTSDKEKEESEEQKALKTMWQKEKLAAAIEEENEEIPENVFEMAVNSITKEDGLASESLAEIYIKQQKYDKAIDMYRKLSLRNPQKNTYFAAKIEEILKEKQS